MKVLIVGAGGQLGVDLVNYLATNYEVISAKREQLDITNLDKVISLVSEMHPDVIINAAAYTKVDDCEKKPEVAFKINSIGAKNLAIASLENNSRLLYISTDYVFDGEKNSPYLEFDKTDPINVYGSSKLLGEELVRQICSRHYILRTSWLYGKNGNNFIKGMLALSEKSTDLKVVNDQIGCPTNTMDLVRIIELLINSQAYGTYHGCNSGECSWYDFAKKIFELKGKKNIEVLPITSSELNRPARRPKYSVMKNQMLELQFDYYARSWEEALNDYLSEVDK